MSKRIIVLGGDGFCGWPTSLYLSAKGHDVHIVDNLSRRAIDEELGADSLTPIASMDDRLAAWKEVSDSEIGFSNIDVAQDYVALRDLIAEYKPDTVIQFAEQRAAPYSMHAQRADRHLRAARRHSRRSPRHDGRLRLRWRRSGNP